MADMEALNEIALRHRLTIVEDCAHMHGGVWNGTPIGSIGDVGSFSFQQTKTMSCGEGGICITNNAATAERLYRVTHVGYGPNDIPKLALSAPPPDLLCYNFRATAFQAVILQRQLDQLSDRLDLYERNARRLEDRLEQTTRIRFQRPGRKATRQGYFGWVMLFDAPEYVDVPIDLLQRAMTAEGLPVLRGEGPIYNMVLFNVSQTDFRIHSPCEVTEHVCKHMLWLLHPYLGLDEDNVNRIAEVIEKVTANIGALQGQAHSRLAPRALTNLYTSNQR
jgi:dTDP-4-amino-4,6-dideoxygalactose transaminase